MKNNREQAAEISLHIARQIEELLNQMNSNKEDFVVRLENTVVHEVTLHEDIAKYMRLYNSLMGEKPA